MGPSFDRWLAKPSTLHFLRNLIAPCTGPTTARPATACYGRIRDGARRYVTAATAPEDENEAERMKPYFERLKDTKRRRASSKAAEIGLRMSLNAGVSFLEKDYQSIAYEALKHQTDVNNDNLTKALLVDDPAHRENYSLWIEIIRFRHRIDGFEGVYDVWRGMRKRGIDLPTSGPDADKLWTEFIEAGICQKQDAHKFMSQLREEIFEYAKDLRGRTGVYFADLHKTIVGRWLHVSPVQAEIWHKRLEAAALSPSGSLSRVVPDALRSETAFNVFTSMYRASENRDLYDSCMNEVLNLGVGVRALRWHRMFLKYGDGPSTDMFAREDVQRLFAVDQDASLPMKMARGRAKSEASTDKDSAKNKFPRLTRESMNTLVGDAHGIKPKEISDAFCAKLFATRAFSIDLVLNGLSFFGVEKLGPLATREMALRAGSHVNFNDKISALKTLGITPDQSAFSRMATKLASDGNATLWTALMESDQHPETYHDLELQEQLLTSHLATSDWIKAHLSLAILASGGRATQHRGWNRILQHYIQVGNYQPVLDTMKSIQDQRLPLTLRTVNILYRVILPRRRPGRAYIKGKSEDKFDHLRFFTKSMMYAAEVGSLVPPYMWSEILKRYGMNGRWDDLRRLLLWISHRYSETNDEHNDHLLASNSSPQQIDRVYTIRSIFTREMVRAIFTWGFRYASSRKRLHIDSGKEISDDREAEVERWAEGLPLLRTLQQEGFPIYLQDVQAEFVLRMWMLFGPAWSTKRVNNEARVTNRISLAHYISHANEVWPGLVDWVDPSLLQASDGANGRLLVEFFGPTRPANRKRRVHADVKAWANALGQYSKDYVYEPFTTRAKRHAWENSTFRIPPAADTPTADHASTYNPTAILSPPPKRQSPSARSSSSHPPPSPLCTPELP